MTMTPATNRRDRNRARLCPLADTGFIEVAGADAEDFLNAQLSRNVDPGPAMRATLAGWLDAGGRVLAMPWVLRTGRRWLLMAGGADTEALIRRMKMFVLRADVRLRDVTEDWEAAALVGEVDSRTAQACTQPGNRPGDTVAVGDEVRAIRIGPRLVHLLARRGSLRTIRDRLAGGTPEAAAAEEAGLGLVRVVPGLAGRFTAHMLNLDRLGAVSFDKGCYPGQEVIARTQNLGRVKRRIFLFRGIAERIGISKQLPVVGATLLDSDGEPVGEVVQAHALEEQGVRLLAMVRVDAASGDLACESGDGLTLTRGGLTLTRESLPWE